MHFYLTKSLMLNLYLIVATISNVFSLKFKN